MDFSDALDFMKQGLKVAREGWNGKGMWICICKGATTYDVPLNAGFDASLARNTLPFIIMKTADECLVPWLASQTDILATDWVTVK